MVTQEEKLLLDAEPVPLRDLFYLRGGAVGVVARVTAVTQQHVAVVRSAQAHLACCSYNRQHVLDMATDKKMIEVLHIMHPHCGIRYSDYDIFLENDRGLTGMYIGVKKIILRHFCKTYFQNLSRFFWALKFQKSANMN
jgi:hypothetical protein